MRSFASCDRVTLLGYYPIYFFLLILNLLTLFFSTGVCQYLSMSFFMDAASLLLWYFLKLPTAANFRFPYASTSPADFWNRRWNLPVSQAMRALIYDPFLEGRLIKPFEKEKAPSSSLSRNSNSNHNTKLLRRVIGVLLVFSVSGIVHEIMYWYVTGHTTRSALWLWYFIFSGLIVVVEGAVKQPLRRAGVQIPTWIQWIVTQFMCKFSCLSFSLLTGFQI